MAVLQFEFPPARFPIPLFFPLDHSDAWNLARHSGSGNLGKLVLGAMPFRLHSSFEADRQIFRARNHDITAKKPGMRRHNATASKLRERPHISVSSPSLRLQEASSQTRFPTSLSGSTFSGSRTANWRIAPCMPVGEPEHDQRTHRDDGHQDDLGQGHLSSSFRYLYACECRTPLIVRQIIARTIKLATAPVEISLSIRALVSGASVPTAKVATARPLRKLARSLICSFDESVSG